MLRVFALLLSIFSPCVYVNFSEGGNQHLLEAFLRSGDLNQAERFIQAFPSQDPEFHTLRSVVSYCRSEEGSYQDLVSAWSEVGLSFKKRVSRYLISCLSDKEPELLKLHQLKQIFGKKLTISGHFRDFFLTSLQVLGEFEDIRKYEGKLDTVSILEAYVQAHLEGEFEEKLIKRLLKVPLNNGAIVQKILQSFFELGRSDLVLEVFERIRSRRQPWIASIYIYLGEELKNDQLVIEGYRRRINTNPLNFESYRGLATHYFSKDQMRTGDEVLLKYLRKFPHKYQGAREIAQVLIDFERFDELMMFVRNIRSQLKDDRAFVDVVLYAYSIKLKPKEFLSEVFRIDPSINPKNWARRIVDSFQVKFIQEVYAEFKNTFSKISLTNLQLLIRMVQYSKVELGDWIDSEFSTFMASEVEIEANKLLSRSQFEIGERLLRAVKNRPTGFTQSEKNLFGQMLYRRGQYSEAYSYLESMVEAYDGDGELYYFLVNISARTTIWRQFLMQWLVKLKSSQYWKRLPEVDRVFVHYTSMEQQIFENGLLSKTEQANSKASLSNEQKVVLQMVDDLLHSDKIALEGTLKRMKNFLNSELSAQKYPMVQHLYLQMVDLKTFYTETFWKDFLGVVKAGYSGQSQILEERLERLEVSLQDHHAEVLFRETMLMHRCLLIHRSIYRGIEKKSAELQLVQWENAVSKLFEQFPQSLYTPLAVEQLVLYLDVRNLSKRRDQWIRRYMLKYSSDLLAQKFRNKLL